MKALLLQKALEVSIALAIFKWPSAEPILKGGFSVHRKKTKREAPHHCYFLCHLLEWGSATSATRQFYRISWWIQPVPGGFYRSDTRKRTKSYKSWCQQTYIKNWCASTRNAEQLLCLYDGSRLLEAKPHGLTYRGETLQFCIRGVHSPSAVTTALTVARSLLIF